MDQFLHPIYNMSSNKSLSSVDETNPKDTNSTANEQVDDVVIVWYELIEAW